MRITGLAVFIAFLATAALCLAAGLLESRAGSDLMGLVFFALACAGFGGAIWMWHSGWESR